MHTFNKEKARDCENFAGGSCAALMLTYVFIADAPEVEVRAARRHHHPRLQQPRLVVACNVSADPPPDVNWQKGTVQYSTVQYSTVQYRWSYVRQVDMLTWKYVSM